VSTSSRPRSQKSGKWRAFYYNFFFQLITKIKHRALVCFRASQTNERIEETN
jgi:hypothetical protein